MEQHSRKSNRQRVIVLCAAFALSGCADLWSTPSVDILDNHAPRSTEERQTTKEAEHLPWRERPIGQDQWARTFPDAKHPELVPPHRWRHATLEGADGELLAEGWELDAALNSGNELAQANAQLLTWRHFSATEGLVDAENYRALVNRSSLPVNLRCAAADSLADAGDAGQLLALELLNEQADLSAKHSSKHVAELHEELLRGVARHQPPTISPSFTTSLEADSPKVRLVAVEAWAAAPASALPERLVDLARDADVAVRCAALRTLAATGHARALEAARGGLTDPQLDVRLAAIAALGKINAPEAVQLLRREAESDGNLIRAASVAALAERGEIEAVLAAATDRDSRVREAAGGALATVPPAKGVAVARELIADRSMAVRRQTITSIAAWPLADAAPLLFTALEDRALDTRQAAAKALAANWPTAGTFRPTATADERGAQLAALRQQFQQDFSGGAPAAALPVSTARSTPTVHGETKSLDQLADVLGVIHASAPDSPEQRQALEQLRDWPGGLEAQLVRLVDEQGAVIPEVVYKQILASESPVNLVNWSTATAIEKRQFVSWLVENSVDQPYRPLVIRRLIERVTVEADPLLWQGALDLCRVQSDPLVRRFAAAALGHASPEVRRRACEHFANYPGEEAVPWLHVALADEASYVAAAAARAIARCGRPADLTALADLLARDDQDCQLAAAAALTCFGDERGRAALERLAFHPDPKVRIRAAHAMGESAEAEFAATLIALLDDDLGVRRAALVNLPLVTNHALSAEEAATTQSQAAAWKRWAAERQ